MTREETIKFLAMIKVAYPTAFRDMDNDTKHATINMWHSTFPDTPFFIIEMAFDHFRKVSKFPPTVAEMHEELRGIYTKASGDMWMALFTKDQDLIEKSGYIKSITEQYYDIAEKHSINYDAISNDHLLNFKAAKHKIALGGTDEKIPK